MWGHVHRKHDGFCDRGYGHESPQQFSPGSDLQGQGQGLCQSRGSGDEVDRYESLSPRHHDPRSV